MESNKYNIKEDYDYLEVLNACSSMDCTGLIPRGMASEQERDSYNNIYEYQPPKENMF